jgi:hypothetical protein
LTALARWSVMGNSGTLAPMPDFAAGPLASVERTANDAGTVLPVAAPTTAAPTAAAPAQTPPPPVEIGGAPGPDPTRFGDWEKSGRCIDF